MFAPTPRRDLHFATTIFGGRAVSPRRACDGPSGLPAQPKAGCGCARSITRPVHPTAGLAKHGSVPAIWAHTQLRARHAPNSGPASPFAPVGFLSSALPRPADPAGKHRREPPGEQRTGLSARQDPFSLGFVRRVIVPATRTAATATAAGGRLAGPWGLLASAAAYGVLLILPGDTPSPSPSPVPPGPDAPPIENCDDPRVQIMPECWDLPDEFRLSREDCRRMYLPNATRTGGTVRLNVAPAAQFCRGRAVPSRGGLPHVHVMWTQGSRKLGTCICCLCCEDLEAAHGGARVVERCRTA